MYHNRAPGVYFERTDKRITERIPLRTDIAGFVGIAQRGPLHTPTKVESWIQFTSEFGTHIPQGYLAYAVEGFFANGGRTCWIVRVAAPDEARAAWIVLADEQGVPFVRLTATSPGTWAHQVSAGAIRTSGQRFTLILQGPGSQREVWSNLQIPDITKDFPDQALGLQEILNNVQTGSRLVKVCVAHDTDRTASNVARLGQQGWLAGGQEGLRALQPIHFHGLHSINDDQPAWGVASLGLVDEISMVAVPDAQPKLDIDRTPTPQSRNCEQLEYVPPHPSASLQPLEFPPQFDWQQVNEIQQLLVAHCEQLGDRMAIIDSPFTWDGASVSVTGPRGSMFSTVAPAIEVIKQWRKRFNSRYAALYYPWLMVSDPLRLQGLLRLVPPCGHVAGIFARVDRNLGVHKPPANEEIVASQNVQFVVDEIEHGMLNEIGVNVIRVFPGRGVRLAGARTANQDSDTGPEPLEQRYINIRRLLMMIRELLEEQLNWLVFEPNTPALWEDIERIISGLLRLLWQRGMLDGTTQDDAYFVRCNESTNPPEAVERGILTCLIGIQPPWPAEFVVVRIGISEGRLTITSESVETQAGSGRPTITERG